MTSQHGTASNQRWSNVVYFNIDVNIIRQRRNMVVFFNVEFHNVGQRRDKVVKMTISESSNKKSFQLEYTEFKVLTAIL